MKKLKVILATFVILGVVFALGPRASVDSTLRPVTLPADLEGYLAASEARFTDVRIGTQKTIVWADSAKMKTSISVVYLHGFSATRQETRPLCDTVAARLGANLFYTRLTGHGRSDDAMAEATANAWLNDAKEALEIGRQLGEQVLLVGTSTGGTLATWLAAQENADDLLALVLISPNFAPQDPDARFLIWPWGKTIVRLVQGEYMIWTPHNDAQARYWNTRYPSESLVTMMSLVDLVEHTNLDAITSPALLIYSPLDQVVSADKIKKRFPEFGSTTKQLVALEDAGDPSNHVLAGAILSPENTEQVAELILEFVEPHLN